ncbi:hypothetical protein [Williamsia muralis]|uniref:hypothetical protein n=1 Tax=Williamsia marianensis TaxID=85044 RepID=UPI00380797D3
MSSRAGHKDAETRERRRVKTLKLGVAAQTVRRDKLTETYELGWTADVVDGELTWSLR